MTTLAQVIRWTGSCLITLLVAVGCVSTAQREAATNQLQRAQVAFDRAQADPATQAHAQLQLADARKTLDAAKSSTDVDDIKHLGYMAERQAQTAQTMGEARKTELDTLQLNQETNQILLQKREREARLARAEAEARARDLERARLDNERARQENEARARQIAEARRELETQAQATEQARLQADQARQQAASAQAEASALAREVSELKARPTDRGMVLTMGDVLFATGKAEVAPGAQRSVDKLVEFLKKYPKRNVLVEGYTDNTGSQDLNLQLSQDRADAVKGLLVARGISPDRIATKGYGVRYPVVSNDSASGRQQNRRVEVVVLNEGASAESVMR